MYKNFLVFFVMALALMSCGYKGPIKPNTELSSIKIEQL